LAKQTEHVFEASPGRLYDAALRAAASIGYSVKYTDKDSLVMSFNTGMSMRSWSGQAMTASIFADAGGSRLLLTGGLAKKGTVVTGGQLVGWGEKGAVTRKFVDAVGRALPGTPEPAAVGHSGTAGELERLVSLHASGGITDAEFASAKALALG